MKRFFKIFICPVTVFYFISCSPGKYTVSANGDTADIKLKSGKGFEAELISISDTAVFFETIPDKLKENHVLFYSLLKDIKSIEVQGYSGSGWIPSVLFFQVLPVGLLCGAAASVDNSDIGAVALIFSVPAVLTTVLLAASEGDSPKWNDQMSLEEIGSLKLYTRYQVPLSEAEISRLLKRYNQNTINKDF
ncbi:MAG TPA: hypothetical protein VMT35_06600 [Ignavibacteriaceae bacterium]|nr:hypothetical protein [Ignavibacteriaceae bacterium]